MCAYCESGVKLIDSTLVKLKNIGIPELYHLNSNDEVSKIKTDLEKKMSTEISLEKKNLINNIFVDLESIKAYFYHLAASKRQRDSYNNLKKNLKTDELFIELDWKQKVILLD